MKKLRIIPIVLFKDGYVVQSKTFSEYRNLGNPYDSIRRFSEWGADEVCFIDIGSKGTQHLHRSDLGRRTLPTYLEVLEEISLTASMPLASGGKIRTLNDIDLRLSRGADKVILNTSAFSDLTFLEESTRNFGAQCIVVSIDVKIIDGVYKIFTEGGGRLIEGTLENWIEKFESIGVGELLVNSIDRDGTKSGYDLILLEKICNRISLPLIACGGAGSWSDMESALNIPGIDAVAAANIFQHTDQSVFLAHKHLYNNGINVRKPQLLR
jgi:cyclase